MIVLKFGGSLAEGDGLRSQLDAVAASGGGTVIVPGGGAYADATVTALGNGPGFIFFLPPAATHL